MAPDPELYHIADELTENNEPSHLNELDDIINHQLVSSVLSHYSNRDETPGETIDPHRLITRFYASQEIDEEPQESSDDIIEAYQNAKRYTETIEATWNLYKNNINPDLPDLESSTPDDIPEDIEVISDHIDIDTYFHLRETKETLQPSVHNETQLQPYEETTDELALPDETTARHE